MGKLTLKQAAAWCGGWVDPKYENMEFFGANNDTRVMKPGQLFVVLQGARDGHDFIPAAMERGAAAALCSRSVGDYPCIIVEDPRIALGQIAKAELQRIGCKVVAITGSVGKSTTKEMVATVLESTYRIAKTPANHNNDIGMPMAILSMAEDTEVAVLEMGMNHFREIAYLSEIARPDIGAVVNIGSMHIEYLGSIEGIRKAKLEILEGMKKDGKLVLNGDDSMLAALPELPEQEVVYYGSSNGDYPVYALEITQKEGILSFRVKYRQEEFPVELALEGRHFVSDALTAITVGLLLDVPAERIRESLFAFRNMAGRQEIYKSGEYTIISDCYNAGPESMAAALAVLGSKPGRRIAVLGEMLELGDCAWAEHFKVGRIAKDNADMVLAYGHHGPRVVSGALTGGMSSANARSFDTHEEMIRHLKRTAKPGDVLLFKGSHGMHMEKVLEGFLKEEKE